MFWAAAGITLLICVGLIAGGSILISRLNKGGSSTEKDNLVLEVERLNSAVDRALKSTESFFSIEQFEAVKAQVQDVQLNLDNQKRMLKEVETKLEEAQKTIEEKESYHQSMKSAKAEDEEKLAGLLARFEDIAAESISLEQKLAASLKSLDQMMTELQLTQEQKEMFENIQTALTEASSQLRELYIEYDSIKKRIDTLNLQLEDLEIEYTKLVEQQLGE